MPTDFVSIILPTHNGARWIGSAIKSVLSQTYENFELIIIDDGSTDGTEAAVNSVSDSRVRYVKNETNVGIQRSLNRGLLEAHGAFIARIDDDDVWIDSHKLEKQARYFENHPECVLVGTSVVVADEEGKELFRFQPPMTDEAIRGRMLTRNCFTHSSVMFRRSAVRTLEGYSEDESVKHLEDYDLWLRLGTIGTLANLPDYAVRFALRAGGLSSRNRADQYRRDIALIRKFKTKYPNYVRGFITAHARLWAYRLFAALPFRNSLLRLYKSL